MQHPQLTPWEREGFLAFARRYASGPMRGLLACRIYGTRSGYAWCAWLPGDDSAASKSGIARTIAGAQADAEIALTAAKPKPQPLRLRKEKINHPQNKS